MNTSAAAQKTSAAVHATAANADRCRPPLRLAVVGLGPVGRSVLAAALADRRFKPTVCVDTDVSVAPAAHDAGFDGPIVHDVAEATKLGVAGDVAIVCTSSTLSGIAPICGELLDAGWHVVSSCEELIAPRLADDRAARELHARARDAKRAVIGTGVNPGFVMDVLPLMATSVTREVAHITVTRSVDASRRRQRLQDKLGVGITPAEFERRRAANTIGHVGLLASLVFLADHVGWRGPHEEHLEAVTDPSGEVVVGVRHTAIIHDHARVERVKGVLEMYAGAADIDRIVIEGTPSVTLEIPDGVSGDEATVSALLNAAAHAPAAPHGLLSPADLPATNWTAM